MKEVEIERSISGLRETLFKEMEAFRNGKSTVKRAQTVINFSREIINATRLEIVHSALILSQGKTNKHTLLLK